jgi:glycolate oxidase
MTPLFVGSEGTLGVILEAWLRLIPRPESTLSGMFFFSSTINAGKAIASIVAKGKTPSKLEIMDKYCLNALKNAGHFIEGGSDAVLLIEVDGEKIHLKRELEDIKSTVEKFGLTGFKLASSEKENEEIWSLRRSLSPVINSFGNTKMNEDVVVKRSDIPLLFEIVDKLIKDFKLNIVCFGHAGDGNIHVNFMFNREDEETVKHVEQALDTLFTKIIEIGGSISGEHGIGIAKRKFMNYQFSQQQLNLMKQFKKVFDPDNILNPGKILPE